MTVSTSSTGRVLLRGLRIAAACAIVYLVVLEVFLAVPLLNETTQVRPAAGLGPALGLMFGLPGALGCALGNLVSDLIHWPHDPALPWYFLIQLIYAYALRGLWRVVFKGEDQPRLASARHIAVFVAGAFADAMLVTALLMPFEADALRVLDINEARLLNNFLAAIYVGMPIVMFLERRRTGSEERNLSERLALISLVMTALASVLCVGITVAFEEAEPYFNIWRDFDELIAQIYLMLTAISVCLFGLACAMLHVLDRSLATPLRELAVDARTLPKRMEQAGPERMRDGELDVQLSATQMLSEIELVAAETNQMRRTLGASMLNVQDATRERERIATELSLASTIQSNALPDDFVDLECAYNLHIEAVMRPARTVGGDFYDVFALDEHRVCALVADVSDKGVPAALFMMRAMTEARDCLRSAASLGEGLSFATAHLCAHNDAMLFVTMFAIALDTRTGIVEYANAGHNLPVVRSATHGNRRLEAKPGLPLGVMEDFYYESGRSRLLPGEQIVLYTDGVTEARSADGALFGDVRLDTALAQEPVQQTSPVDLIEQAVSAFAQGAEQADDLTVLALSWLANASHRHFAADAGLCPQICAFVREQLSEDAIADMAFNLDLIVEELFVNVAMHAYRDLESADPGMDIFVADDAIGHVVHLLIQDSGTPYDPTAHVADALTGSEALDDLQPGGMGILLVRKLSDSMRYERFNGRNILHVTKSYGL